MPSPSKKNTIIFSSSKLYGSEYYENPIQIQNPILTVNVSRSKKFAFPTKEQILQKSGERRGGRSEPILLPRGERVGNKGSGKKGLLKINIRPSKRYEKGYYPDNRERGASLSSSKRK